MAETYKDQWEEAATVLRRHAADFDRLIEDGAATLTIADARRLWSTITEARGWLGSALTLLEPQESSP